MWITTEYMLQFKLKLTIDNSAPNKLKSEELFVTISPQSWGEKDGKIKSRKMVEFRAENFECEDKWKKICRINGISRCCLMVVYTF